MGTLFITLAAIITIAILYGDMKFVDTEIKEKLFFKIYVIYMKIAIAIMTMLSLESIVNDTSTMEMTAFSGTLAVIHIIVILYKDIAFADAETKEKTWFKIYTIYMKVFVGIILILTIDGMKFW